MKNLFVILLVLLSCISCVSRKEIVYFIDDEVTTKEFKEFNLSSQNNVTIKTNDQLAITVTALEQEAAIPFNLPMVGTGTILDNELTPNRTQPQIQTYLVSNDGEIDFPVLGEINVLGLTRNELAALLKEKIALYIKNPMVIVRISNFRITVLGEVARPGTFSVSDEYISLPKALGLAGDLTIYGKRKNIKVLREEGEKMIQMSLDLTDPGIVESPYYYLRQNDIVYVEPNKPQRQAANYNRNASVYISVASVLVSLIVLIAR
ncbi:polysaccharide biosynthesis/export family protein [Leeuwenhoekiella aestuarii]|uniref:polysaccharide biosynthesis/export family protein n=1 Tax=Leeuwenhoekiella aestuarii TaxID=2249426 RepID=UPI000FFE569C|nr:polysaccharide biosynthesis/export family protein [Leeuwenhoekiella aestuarii]